ncbi:Patatin-like protein 8 [Hibiscus syriacus]|uniref:Patatin n=1 Tax=Hibiscus syriacus TaxID=106335 RepID=A0A6A2XA74_HIBSY|nr:Patatin-like protein 8 [Hibiscus syriacus]
MSSTASLEMQEPSIDTDKLSYEIFSILESKFLFGYDDHQKLWIPKPVSPAPEPSPLGHSGDENPSSAIKNQRGKICILSIDTGGMRGILSGKALAYLEHALKSKTGNPNARIADYFDVAAGSGVGGIFTAMLFATRDGSRPIFTAEETWRFLVENGRRIYWSGKSKQNGILKKFLKSSSTGSGSTGMEKVVKDAFKAADGRRLTLKDTLKPVLIPCYDLSSSAPFLFSRADALETDGFDFLLSDVCRATSAEPGIFKPVMMQSVDGQTNCMAIDGGLAMSNPTAAAITHVLHNKQEFPFVRGVEDLLVLSLGTGSLLEISYEYEEVKNWRVKDWAQPLARISGDGSAESVDQAVAMAFGQCRSSNYVRIQVIYFCLKSLNFIQYLDYSNYFPPLNIFNHTFSYTK